MDKMRDEVSELQDMADEATKAADAKEQEQLYRRERQHRDTTRSCTTYSTGSQSRWKDKRYKKRWEVR